MRAAVAFDVALARVHRPDRVADLAPDQIAVVGVARAQRHVGVALHQVEVAVAHHELDPQARVARLEAFDQAGLLQPHHDGFGAGDAHAARHVAARRGHLPPGIAMVSFAVKSFEGSKLPWKVTPRVRTERPYDGRRAGILVGPAGEWIERPTTLQLQESGR